MGSEKVLGSPARGRDPVSGRKNDHPCWEHDTVHGPAPLPAPMASQAAGLGRDHLSQGLSSLSVK